MCSVNLTGMEGFVFGLAGGVACFVVEGGLLNDSDLFYRSYVSIYMEDVKFVGGPGQERIGMTTNGGVSLLRCTFQGMSEGILLTASSSRNLICSSIFQDCVTSIQKDVEHAAVVDCRFDGYEVAALDVTQGGSSAGAQLEVVQCAFLSEGVVAIRLIGWATVNSCVCSSFFFFQNFDALLASVHSDLTIFVISQVKQSLQEFLFNINVTTRVGFQTPFHEYHTRLCVSAFTLSYVS
jgi:hypothetical protein